MSDPTQTCPPARELITTPRRSCARPSNAGSRSCYSAMFPTQGIQYSQVCGRITGYQIGQPGAFVAESINNQQTINDPYVDGVSLTYGNPQQHIRTFANALDEAGGISDCPCTNTNYQSTINIHVPSARVLNLMLHGVKTCCFQLTKVYNDDGAQLLYIPNVINLITRL